MPVLFKNFPAGYLIVPIRWFHDIDWVATGSVLSAVATFSGAAAVVYAAMVGKNTFDNWRKERIEETVIEASRDILSAIYHLKKTGSDIGNRFIRFDEIHEDEFNQDSSPKKSRFLLKVLLQRVEMHRKVLEKFYDIEAKAFVVFGKDGLLDELVSLRINFLKPIVTIFVFDIENKILSVNKGGNGYFISTIDNIDLLSEFNSKTDEHIKKIESIVAKHVRYRNDK